ncbi:HelD family protein [Companilactobacillus kedongensis]|uniref:HelD family protein n=1 Tax=Companilactobacillus kedongensis TaxID=2486004 RepID=UPI000F76B259|nr:UvrD-helicase domain-containing protein [Companilactobacillus kedongensis]
MDSTFDLEQAHLKNVYQELSNTLNSVERLISDNSKNARDFKRQSGHDTALNFDSYADNLDTFASMETMNKQIDYFNSKQTQLEVIKSKTKQLLPSPYFSRIDLQYPDETEAIPFYIGSTGFSKTPEEPLVIDWRSPIADLYYNNKIGKTFYNANNHKIDVDVTTRRQFLLHDDVLQDIFDTDVAIQDPLLVKTLQENKSNQMTSITATIQKEQNLIIRDENSLALLVNGIAGSGKTSVVLQRIAYLLYRYRDTLVAEDVLLLTPNALFTSYINDVLPSLGEDSPSQMTFEQFLANFGDSRDFKNKQSHLKVINENIDSLHLTDNDFIELKLDDTVIFSTNKILEFFNRTPASLSLPKRITALAELLLSNVTDNIIKLSSDPDIQAQLDDLTDMEQEQIFGKSITPTTDPEIRQATKKMLNWQYRKLIRQIKQKNWLDLSQILTDILGVKEHNFIDFSFIKLKLFNLAKNNIKFVMIDEVQDYTLDELYFLITALPKAKWTLVGDEFQSIKDTNEPLTFTDLENLFETNKISVKQRHLYTSYRSSGNITKAFTKFGSSELSKKIKIIQTDGPEIQKYTLNSEQLNETIEEQIRQFDPNKLSAVITTDMTTAKTLSDDLNIKLLTSNSLLPKNGISVMPLIIAKGLEFDNVIVINNDATYYTNDRIGQNRMYTALSRASKNLIIDTI